MRFHQKLLLCLVGVMLAGTAIYFHFSTHPDWVLIFWVIFISLEIMASVISELIEGKARNIEAVLSRNPWLVYIVGSTVFAGIVQYCLRRFLDVSDGVSLTISIPIGLVAFVIFANLVEDME